MKHKLLLSALFILLASFIFSCTHGRHHRDPHKKYRVLREDSAQKVDMDDHMRDYQPH
jgi:hypothetical protein